MDNFNGISSNSEYVIHKLDDIFRLLNEHGIRLNPNSRFHRFRKDYESFQSKDYMDDLAKLFDDIHVVEGMKDFWELNSIVSSKKILKDNLKEIQIMMGGSLDPYKDKSNKVSRNMQYQLLMASLLEQSGYKISIEEPDFAFFIKEKKYGVACKRISSKKKMSDRLKEGDRQLRNNNLKGFIAVDINQLVGLNFYKFSSDTRLLMQDAKDMLISTIDKIYPERIVRLSDDTIGALISINMVGYNPFTKQLSNAFYLQPYVVGSKELYDEKICIIDGLVGNLKISGKYLL